MPPRPAAAALLLLAALPLTAQPAPDPGRDARMGWWREARFGMFIHWGLYAIPGGTWNGRRAGGTGEWILQNARITVPDYETLLPKFDPVKFDARAWARIAREAGMKYLVITSKHHDGFCLWDSAATDWDVAASPFKRDILAELAEACKAEGIRFCLYHSIMDWHHPDYLPRRPWDTRPVADADFGRFRRYLEAQLGELVQRFHPAVLWFDGEWEDTWTHDHGKELFAFVRKLDPSMIVNNRVDKGRQGMQGMTMSGDYCGDFGTPEQEIPATGFPGVDWESCMTMNDTWGWRSDDENWKPAKTMIRMLADIASKGGNFLLNVGPTSEGLIPGPSVERLAAIGRWMRTNGESIHGSGPTPFQRLPWRCTTKPGRLYVHLFEWPGRTIEIRGLVTAVNGAWLLADPERKPLAVQPGRDTVKIGLPEKGPDEADSVLVLELSGPPVTIALPIGAAEDGSFTLAAAEAGIHGKGARYEAEDSKRCIGFWTDAADWVSWEFEVAKPGSFDVEIELACEEGTAGTAFSVEVGDQKISGKVPATGGWSRFQTVKLSRISLPSPGPRVLAIRPSAKPSHAVMNLRSVRLVPAR